MSVVGSELIYYGAASIAENDASTQGGAISTSVRYIFDSSTLANTLNDTIEMLSSNAGDTTQNVVVTGRSSGGSIITETFNLNGTTVVNGVTSFARIMKIVVSGAHTGTITVRKATGDTLIASIETGVLQIRKPFYNVSSDASGGSSRDFYEKIFIKNTNGSLNLLSAVVSEQADPSAVITFDLESSVGGSNSVASRLNTAPTGMLGTFTGSAKNVPGTDLEAGAAIGVWLKLTLPAGNAAILDTYTLRIAGSST